MDLQNRYIVVAMDRQTGEIYLSPDTIRDSYGRDEAAELLTTLAEQLKPLNRIFFILPFDKAISLWYNESEQDDKRETDRFIH